jgi:hypothetical protein
MGRKIVSDRIKKPWGTKYTKDLCEKVVKHHKQGGSMNSFVSVAGACKETLSQWRARYPEFDQACITAQSEYQKMLESILLAKLAGRPLDGFDPKKSDTACLIFALKTRCHQDYSEKNRLELENGKITINIDKDDDKL